MLFVLLLLLIDIGQLAYRFTLPTDGWYVVGTDADNGNWNYLNNLVGAPSELRAGDVLLTVDEVDVQRTAMNETRVPPGLWRVGDTVTMQVKRGDLQIPVRVPVVHWTFAALVRAQVEYGVQMVLLFGDIVLLAVAWLTFLRRPDMLATRALLVFATALACPTISSMLPDGISVEFDKTAFWFTTIFSYAIFVFLVGPSLFALTLLFPKTKPMLVRHPWLQWLPAGIGVIVLFLTVIVYSGILYLPRRSYGFSPFRRLWGLSSASSTVHSLYAIQLGACRCAGQEVALPLAVCCLRFISRSITI